MTKYFYGQVTTAKIADGAVTTPKLADGAATYIKCYDKTQAGSVASGLGGLVTIVFAPAFAGVPNITFAVAAGLPRVYTMRITALNAVGCTGTLEENVAGSAAAGTTNLQAAHDHDVIWQASGQPPGILAGAVGAGHTEIVAFLGQTDVDMVQVAGAHAHTTSADAVAIAPLGAIGVTVHWVAFYDTP